MTATCFGSSYRVIFRLSPKKMLYTIFFFFFFFSFALALRPYAGHGLLILEVSRSHMTMHHSQQDSSGRVISSSQRPVSDNTQQSQQTSMALVGFEPTISAGERPQTYTLDRAATGTGVIYNQQFFIQYQILYYMLLIYFVN